MRIPIRKSINWQEAERVASDYGLSLRYEAAGTGRHPKAVFECRGKVCQIPISSTEGKPHPREVYTSMRRILRSRGLIRETRG